MILFTLLLWAACGGVVQRAQGHIFLDSYPTNARCEWTVRVERGSIVELRWVMESGLYLKLMKCPIGTIYYRSFTG